MNLLRINTTLTLEQITETLLEQGTQLGISIVKALVILIIGRYVIRFLNKLIKKVLREKNVEPAVRTFVESLANIVLMVLLVISVIGALGVQTTSFAAILASAGIAIGMALSGNLSNFAGGLVILLFKPFKIGDYIQTSEIKGTVTEIQIFHTVLNTFDNIRVHIPNGTLSSGYINNYSVDQRRIEWIFGVEYGEDFDKVKSAVLDVLSKDLRILPNPEPFIELSQLDSSSVNVVVRVWVKATDYWDVYFAINQGVYKTFNKVGINFPFPQLTVHQAK